MHVPLNEQVYIEENTGIYTFPQKSKKRRLRLAPAILAKTPQIIFLKTKMINEVMLQVPFRFSFVRQK